MCIRDSYDFGGAPLWRKELVCAQRTELALVEGFFAGTPARPLVMLYAYGDGLTAIDPASGAEVWRVGSEQVNLGGSITHAVGADGTIYVGGYYGPEPVYYTHLITCRQISEPMEPPPPVTSTTLPVR